MPSAQRAAGDAAHRFITIQAFSRMLGIHEITGWRLLRKGNGPKVTQLSNRRVGIRADHLKEWLDSRVRATIEK